MTKKTKTKKTKTKKKRKKKNKKKKKTKNTIISYMILKNQVKEITLFSIFLIV